MSLHALGTDAAAAAESLRPEPGFTAAVVALTAGAIAAAVPVLGLFRLVVPWPPAVTGSARLEPLPDSGWALPLSDRAVPAARIQAEALGELSVVLGVLAAAVVLVAAAGLVSLLAGRAAARRQEIAVHVVHGATRARLARRLLMEASFLAAPGLAIGLAASVPLQSLLARATPAGA
jgi:hypothetical protein